MGAASYHLATRQPENLRIVSWNVGGAGGHGGRSLRNEFLPHIAAVLKKLNADVILLQEVAAAHQVQRLSRMLDGPWEVIVSARYDLSRVKTKANIRIVFPFLL